MLYVDVILPLPLDGLFTYSVPDALTEAVKPLKRVLVPFGITKTHTALAVKLRTDLESDTTPDGHKIRPILSVLDDEPAMLPEQLRLWQWISRYYMSPLGDILKAALPPGMKKEGAYRQRMETYVCPAFGVPHQDIAPEELAAALRTAENSVTLLSRSPKQQAAYRKYLEISGWDWLLRTAAGHPDECADEAKQSVKEITREELINTARCTSATVSALTAKGLLRLYDKPAARLNTVAPPHPENIKPLSEAQQRVYDDITQGDDRPVLLHGVTSSGKTEIYIRLIQDAIDRGEQVMYLVPEIALTVQMTERLQRVFGGRLGIYHSKYSDAERTELWRKQLGDEPYEVILGARSAVFLPYRRLGLVIVDEEHETSFKQQDPSPRYHARSVALMLAKWSGARVVLGTATPSVESYHNAETGKYRLVTLTERYAGLQLPRIEVVDTSDLRRRKIMRGMFSPRLKAAVNDALNRGEQAIIFLNRRGFAPVIECHQCGWLPKCPNCDVSLTYHKTTSSLTCHYCGHSMRMPEACPECGNRELKSRGAGTEKLEDGVADEFPQARIARMDLDTTRTRNAHERIIEEFAAGKTNLLIGTQMVTKGLDFDRVSVVGIISADTMLTQPDFRAHEHGYAMMTQVAGRAGRKGRRGSVILQTNHPEAPIIGQIARTDYAAMYRAAIAERRDYRYPPFSRLVYAVLRHRDDLVADSAAVELASRLRQAFPGCVMGPYKPSVARVKTLNIRQIMLKLPPDLPIERTRQTIRQAADALLADPRRKSLLIHYDIDPM